MSIKRLIWADAKSGGAAGAMDAYPSASLVDGSGCLVVTSDPILALYRYNATSSDTDNGDTVIAPDDIGASPGRWIKIQTFQHEIVSTNGGYVAVEPNIFTSGWIAATNYFQSPLYNTVPTGTSLLNTNFVAYRDSAASQIGVITWDQSNDEITFDKRNTSSVVQNKFVMTDTETNFQKEVQVDGDPLLALDSAYTPAEGDIPVYDGSIWVGEPLHQENWLYNPQFFVKQRYASSTSATITSGYTADRWYCWTAASSMTVGFSTSLYDFSSFRTRNRCRGAIYLQNNGNGTPYAIVQRLPANENVGMKGRDWTLSFLTYSNLAATAFTSGFVYGLTSAKTYATGQAQTTHTTALNWKYHEINFTVSAHFDIETIVVYLAYGFALNSTSDYIYIADAKLEPGNTATPSIQKSFIEDRARCLPYYQNSFQNVTPANSIYTQQIPGMAYATTDIQCWVPFAVEMYAIPTIGNYGDASGHWQYYDGGAWNAATGSSNTGIRTTGFNKNVTSTGLTANECHLMKGDWTATAEL